MQQRYSWSDTMIYKQKAQENVDKFQRARDLFWEYFTRTGVIPNSDNAWKDERFDWGKCEPSEMNDHILFHLGVRTLSNFGIPTFDIEASRLRGINLQPAVENALKILDAPDARIQEIIQNQVSHSHLLNTVRKQDCPYDVALHKELVAKTLYAIADMKLAEVDVDKVRANTSVTGYNLKYDAIKDSIMIGIDHATLSMTKEFSPLELEILGEARRVEDIFQSTLLYQRHMMSK